MFSRRCQHRWLVVQPHGGGGHSLASRISAVAVEWPVSCLRLAARRRALCRVAVGACERYALEGGLLSVLSFSGELRPTDIGRVFSKGRPGHRISTRNADVHRETLCDRLVLPSTATDPPFVGKGRPAPTQAHVCGVQRPMVRSFESSFIRHAAPRPRCAPVASRRRRASCDLRILRDAHRQGRGLLSATLALGSRVGQETRPMEARPRLARLLTC